jgi:hypothetical protein
MPGSSDSSHSLGEHRRELRAYLKMFSGIIKSVREDALGEGETR